ncbi:PREDICTED: Golgi reassembly-stacking protein 2-like, partial [Rhagoletis zephyria]|uniref:Golgi reassembly-stacking protein 2-like n=1 Tax=Rhagoletis zephyria TaxID=28612 RepID=UPI0008118AE3
MGSSQSVEIPGGGTEGYHVLKNQNNDTLKEILKASIDKPLKMIVYNSKKSTIREVELTPNNKWGGQGLLGVSIRFASFEGASENVWHVLDIAPNSPADVAGLHANTDYIIGADSMIQDNDDLYNLISSYEGKPLKLFVYNVLADNCREVTIIPNSNWGGQGSLGCDIGYGYLHRIPVPKSATEATETTRLMTSTDLQSGPPPPPPSNNSAPTNGLAEGQSETPATDAS